MLMLIRKGHKSNVAFQVPPLSNSNYYDVHLLLKTQNSQINVTEISKISTEFLSTLSWLL